jgi:YHS domain-containing protein
MRVLACLLTVAVVVLGLAVAGCCCLVGDQKEDGPEAAEASGDGQGTAAAESVSEAPAVAQARCPVMGGSIDRAIYADYEGRRVYFCCTGCIAAFEKDPAMYLAKLYAEPGR